MTLDESVAYHVVDLNIRYHHEGFRLKTRRIVERPLGPSSGDSLRRWGVRWAKRNGHILQPEMEVTDLTGTRGYLTNEGMILGVSWRYIENGRAVLGDRELVVAPGIHVLRVPCLSDEDKARMTAALMAGDSEDDDEDGLD